MVKMVNSFTSLITQGIEPGTFAIIGFGLTDLSYYTTIYFMTSFFLLDGVVAAIHLSHQVLKANVAVERDVLPNVAAISRRASYAARPSSWLQPCRLQTIVKNRYRIFKWWNADFFKILMKKVQPIYPYYE